MPLPQSRRLDFDEVPVIDVSPIAASTDVPETIAAMGQACRDVGFFYVSGHGISKSVVDALRAEADVYFASPTETKMTAPIDQRMRGYLPLDYASYPGEDRAAKSRQEGFWIGHDRPLDAANPLDGPNYWPADQPALRTAMMAYFEAVETLAETLRRGFAMALGLAPDALDAMLEPSQSLLKLNHYPPQENPTSISHIGVVPHSDSGAFTVLWQDDHGGLEVQSKSGDWVGAPPIPDTFVINLGNVMQIWTDGKFSSTPHRVINRGNADRYSIPLFVNPSATAKIGSQFGKGNDAVPYIDYQRGEWRRAFPIAKIPK